MTIQLRWPLRVLALVVSPFVMLGTGRAFFLALESFALWIGLDTAIAEGIAGYFGTICGMAIGAGLVFGAFRVWRPRLDQTPVQEEK